MSSPIQFPCGKPGQPPCPPEPCIAGLNHQQILNVHEYALACFNAGIAKKTAEYELAMQELTDTEQD